MRRLAVAAHSSVVSERFSEGLVLIGSPNFSFFLIRDDARKTGWQLERFRPEMSILIITIFPGRLKTKAGASFLSDI